jgi:hypothetical protein
MEISDQFISMAALLPEKEPTAPTTYKAGKHHKLNACCRVENNLLPLPVIKHGSVTIITTIIN